MEEISKLPGFRPGFWQGRARTTRRAWRPRQRITVQEANGVNCLTLRYQGEARSTRLAREQFRVVHTLVNLPSAVGPCMFDCYPVSLFPFFFGRFHLS
jgi:hypothetical protein